MIERRTFELLPEVRDEGDGRTLTGIAIPYGVDAKIGSYTEQFVSGAFSDVDPAQVPLMAVHDREQLPIGRAVSFTETPDGLRAELRVSETALGNDVLQLVRDGALRGLSIGFVPLEDAWNTARDRVKRVKAQLKEISLTPFPAYPDAVVTNVRGAGQELVSHHPVPRTPRLQAARRRP